MQGQAPRIQDSGNGDSHVNDHRVKGHDGARDRVVPVFEEFWDREDAGFKKFGEEENSDKNESDGGDPLIACHSHPDMPGALTGHPDKLLGGDVRCDE